MQYIFFVSKEPWSSFNSIYAYVRLRGHFPKTLIAFYSDEKSMKLIEDMLSILYENYDKKYDLKKVRLPENFEDMIKIIESYVQKGDLVDITGARKFTILSLMHLHGINIVYLQLKDMRFSTSPFMMRPLSLQTLMEVKI